MADFALWATACETACWPAGTFENAYWANRRTAVENVIDADPVAACVRDLMAERTTWEGTASDFLQMSAERHGQAMPGQSTASAGWPKNPRALAGRLRRAQTFLRALGIEINFSREGRVGTRADQDNRGFVWAAPRRQDAPAGDRPLRTVSSTGETALVHEHDEQTILERGSGSNRRC